MSATTKTRCFTGSTARHCSTPTRKGSMECKHHARIREKKLVAPLAAEFSRVLRSWLDATDMATVIVMNRDETIPGVCHSHDFCDANMAMDEAFKRVIGRGVKADLDHDCSLWNGAWDLALRSEFRVAS